MPELRWTLLIIGVVFIAILAWWERRRPHQASRESRRDGVESHSGGGNLDAGWGLEPESPGPRALREPTLTLPEIRVREPVSAPHELPVVEIAEDDSLAGLDIAGDPVGRRAFPGSKAAVAPEPIGSRPFEAEPAEPDLEPDLELIASEPIGSAPIGPQGAAPKPREPIEPVEQEYVDPEDLRELEESEELEELEERIERAESVEPQSVATARSPGSVPAEGAMQSGVVSAPDPSAAAGSRPEPIVDWPPEDVRRLVALRLVAPQHERFAGRAVRQALSAEGFVLGKFSIFHKPDAQNRAVLSAASLTKPGTFDLETMDTQRFGGLNLFAVLPGPKPPLKAFEELLATARTLNERLEGALQDERGGPLTPTRVATLRDALGAEARS